LKTYVVSYLLSKPKEQKNLIIHERKALLHITIRAQNIKEVFGYLRNELPRIVIFYIDEKLTEDKLKPVFNKFYFLDKITGRPIGVKLTYNPDSNSYSKDLLTASISNQKQSLHMVISLIRKGKFGDAFLIATETYINPLVDFVRSQTWNVKNDFSRKRALLEKYCIKNGFVKTGKVVNNWRVSKEVIQAREAANFDLVKHLKLRDTTGKTEGCGCLYCKLSHVIYREKQKLANVDIQLFKVMGATKRSNDILTPNGEWIPSTLQGWRLYRMRYPKQKTNNTKMLLRQMDDLRQNIRKYTDVLTALKQELQIPNTSKYGNKKEVNTSSGKDTKNIKAKR